MAKFTERIIFFLWKRINHTSVGQRKYLRLRQDSNLWPPKHRAGALCPLELQRTHGERRHIYIYMLGSYLTRVVRPAYCFDQQCRCRTVWWKNERWWWINQHVTSGGQEKNLRPHQDSNLWPSKHRAGALSKLTHWATENSWRARLYTRIIFDTRPAYCRTPFAVKDHSSQLNMTYFLRQLTSLSAGSNQIDYVLVFSNGLH